MKLDLPVLDFEHVRTKIKDLVRRKVSDAHADGVVIGLSGGVDSSVTAYVCTEAIGKERIYALILPHSSITPAQEIKNALFVANELQVENRVIDIKPIVDLDLEVLGRGHKVAEGNLLARTRMKYLYFYSNNMNRLVAGTGDRSEIAIGYFTKHGDGGADFLPIGCLYKTQVRGFARHLGVPEAIASLPSSPRLWSGQEAEDELGVTYEVLDRILHGFDLGLADKTIVEATGTNIELIKGIRERIEMTEHKRTLPEACAL